MTSTMMHHDLMLDHLIERAEKLFPTVEVVSRRADKSLLRHDYGSVGRRARALAAGLQRAGLVEGDRVATLMWNSHAHLELYFGAPMSGGVYHTLNLRLSPEELVFIVSHARDRFVVVDDVLLPLWRGVVKTAAAKGVTLPVEKVFVYSQSSEPVPEGFLPYESLVEGGDADFVRPTPDEHRAAGLCYTSGTTGKPKGVLYSHRALVLHSFASSLVDMLGLSQKDVIVPVVPMFHANAWGLPFTATMVGAKQVMPGPHLDPASLLDLYEKERVTISAGVPTIWMGIQQALEKEPERYKLQKGLRMVVGGSAAPESMIRAFDRFDMRVIHAWGMTETTPLGSVALPKASMRDLGEDALYKVRATQGLPAPYVELRARGEGGLIAWNGTSLGELEVRGPWVAASYLDNDEAKDKWTDDGWFRTGDVVSIDAEGYIRIADRTKDLIKSGGEWISSVDLENALMGHASVKEAAVIAIPDDKWGERPLAAIVLKDGKAATETELAAHLLQHGFAKWQLPDGYVFRDAIPRTSTGKFMKMTLRDELRAWKARQP
jgi:fatty-acyl-CoA synthase